MIQAEVHIHEAGRMLKKLGLNKRGAVQTQLALEAIRLCDPHVPFSSGMLKQSVHITDGGQIIQWQQPYARYQYYGMLMVDPKYKKGAMFSKNYGFWSRPGIPKELTNKQLNYSGQGESHWFEKAMQNGGREKLIELAREEVRKRST